jgi:hypothetical protein
MARPAPSEGWAGATGRAQHSRRPPRIQRAMPPHTERRLSRFVQHPGGAGRPRRTHGGPRSGSPSSVGIMTRHRCGRRQRWRSNQPMCVHFVSADTHRHSTPRGRRPNVSSRLATTTSVPRETTVRRAARNDSTPPRRPSVSTASFIHHRRHCRVATRRHASGPIRGTCFT